MTNRPFRFGLNLIPSVPNAILREYCKAAEDLGFDVITVSDYITLELLPAGIRRWPTHPPFFALLAAAEVTSSVRLGTSSLNASLYRPALLARDIIAFQNYTGDRLEMGIGAGYIKDDFTTAEVDFGRASDRIDRLERMVLETRRMVTGTYPTLLMGSSTHEELLRLAATYADIVSLTGAESKTEFSQAQLLDSTRLGKQCDYIRSVAADRLDHVELNCLVHAVNLTDDPASAPPPFPNVAVPTPDELSKLPGIMHGTPESIAEDLHRYREAYGISYYTIRVPNMVDFAKVIKLVR